MILSEKKEEEMKYAKFFLSDFNLKNKADYIAIPNDETNDAEVDVLGESETYRQLKIQVKNIDTEYMSSFMDRVKEASESPDGVSKVHSRRFDIVELIEKGIEKCVNKYGPKVRSEMVLLFAVYHGGELNKDYAQKVFLQYRLKRFKGIYLVDLPNIGSNYQGQVTTVKEVNFNSLIKF